MTHGRTLTALVAALAGCGPVFYDLLDGATGGLPGSSGQSDPLTDPTGPGDTHGTEPPPTCGDGQHDGQESDLDCGGPCPPCGPGQMCHEHHDCKEGPCVAGTCAAPECELPEDCTSGDPCRPGTCDLPTHRCIFIDLDGVGCEDGDLCSLGDTCVQGTCVAGEPRDCSDLDAPCAAGVCEPIKGQCVAMPAGDGSPCDEDGLACTPAGKCFQGTCTDPFPQPPPLLFEDFDKPAPDWQLGDMWQIGPAQPSACAQLGSDDPPDDHSPGPDGGLAGALIGGCLPEKPLPAPICLTSPQISLPPLPALWLSYWSRLSAPPAPARATVEVFAGQQWNTVFDTEGKAVDEKVWTSHTIDLSDFKSPNIRVRFCHEQPMDPTPIVAGWSLDDIALGPSCLP